MRTVKVFEEAWPLHTPFVIARGRRKWQKNQQIKNNSRWRERAKKELDNNSNALPNRKNGICRAGLCQQKRREQRQQIERR